MEGEAVATDFEASFDPTSREIKLLDHAKPQVAEFDFSKAIKFPAERNLTIKFQVKLKKVGEQPYLTGFRIRKPRLSPTWIYWSRNTGRAGTTCSKISICGTISITSSWKLGKEKTK